MRFFSLQDYQHWLLSVSLGLLLAILLYLALKSYGYSSERAEKGPGEEFIYPDGLRGRNLPVPPFMLFLYLGFVVWLICYVIVVGILQGPI